MNDLLLSVEVTVPGRPIPKGSTRSFALRGKPGANGRPSHVTIPTNFTELREWEWDIRRAVGEQLGGDREDPIFTGPVEVAIECFFARPKGHYGTGRNAGTLKESAPAHKTSKPDLDKLERAVWDALTGQPPVIRDDSQVVESHARKRFGEPERLVVRVSEAWTPSSADTH